ncbi:MAG: F0F1 ATP synthase subunit A [Lachnospiraceae bacterium]|jgi:F-type H+-transporting ATPase subunit a|nr:F0F1 ATP synthase subunit A [Lachnospiraceae bacterium]
MNDVVIQGAQIYFYIGGIPITATLVNMWIVMLFVLILCIYLTRGLKTSNISKKQVVVELIVKTATNFTINNMGEKYKSLVPFVSALFALSALSSLLGVLGLYSPTSDLSVTIGWSLLVFIMITYTKIKTNKLLGYLKGFTKPIIVLTPFNIISEIATPVSMAFRHFGSIASGSVIMTLLYAALGALSSFILGWLPDPIGSFPLFQIGLPGVLSIYFDVFSAVLQAFIFCMLTTMYIKSAAEE